MRDAIVRQLSIGTSGEALVKLIAVMDDFADITLLPTLMGLLQHPDAEVRRHVAQLMVKIDDPKIQSIIAGLLDDASIEVQTEAVRLIGEKRFLLATNELIRRLPMMAPVVQEEICIALGNFGDKKAAPAMVALLQSEKAFWRRNSGTPDAVRLRAIWALGQLLPEDNAHRALTKVAKDPNPNIQRAAQNALARLSISEQLIKQRLKPTVAAPSEWRVANKAACRVAARGTVTLESLACRFSDHPPLWPPAARCALTVPINS